MPLTSVARPWSKKVGAQANRNRETVAFCLGLKPLVDWSETTSSASSPLVAVPVTVLSGITPHVLLFFR